MGSEGKRCHIGTGALTRKSFLTRLESTLHLYSSQAVTTGSCVRIITQSVAELARPQLLWYMEGLSYYSDR